MMLPPHRPPVLALVAGLMAVGCAKRPTAPVPAASTPASLPAAPSAEQLQLTDGAGGLIGSVPTPGDGRRPIEPGQVQVGDDFVILGALHASRITDVIEQQLPTMTYCYRRALAEEPDIAGELRVRFKIGGDGALTESSLPRTSLANPELESCVVARFSHMTFPPPEGGGIVIATYPLLFSPEPAPRGPDAESIAAELREAWDRIHPCVADAAEQMGWRSEQTSMEFSISLDGSIDRATLRHTAGGAREVHGCMAGVLFPPPVPGPSLRVSYPL